MAKRFLSQELPPCPAPQGYILVRASDGYMHWRRKRGSLSPAVLNAVLRQNAESIRIVSPLCKVLTAALLPFIGHLPIGNLHTRLLTPLRKSFKDTDFINFKLLNKMDILPGLPFTRLYNGSIDISFADNTLSINFLVNDGLVFRPNNLIEDFYFTAIFISGHLESGSLNTSVEQSELFSFPQQENKCCHFVYCPPHNEPWMILLKLTYFEGQQQAANPKYHALKIIATGP